MIRLALIVMALLYLALPAVAQSVLVRSGEHPDFSRLTLNLPERVEWSIAPILRGAHVTFTSGTFDVDPGLIFDRIPRDRLVEARWNAADRRLELMFGCDCEVNGFWFGEAMLVLDVKPLDNPSDAQRGTASDATGFLAPKPTISTASTLLTPFSGILGPADAAPRVEAPEISGAPTIEDARRRLLKQISRATSQGLLMPRRRLPEAGPEVVHRRTPDDPVSRHQVAEGGLIEPLDNLRVTSRIDLDYLEARDKADQPNTQVGCFGDSLLDVAAWGTDAPFGEQIAQLRPKLTGEFDDVNQQAVRRLAKLYLFFGFGAEARDILHLLAEDDSMRHLLFTLAEIAEHGFSSSRAGLANQLDCDSLASFWSALSYADLPEDAVMDDDAILRGFSALPVHLRHYYGPVLSRRFLRSGRRDLASRVLRIMDRTGQSISAEGEMAKAQAELVKGAERLATFRLEGVVESNVEASAEALIAIIETRVRRGETLPPGQAELVAAFAFEKRNEPIAEQLHAAHIRALAASRSFRAAQSVYAERIGEIDPARRPALRTDVVRYLVRDADDVTFLRLAFFDAFDHLEQPDPKLANAFAERVLGLGFPEQAARIIESDLPRNSDAFRERRLLRGEVALALDLPRQALVELLDMTGPRANLLRARALGDAGDHGAAAILFDSASAAEHARVSAMLDGDWAGTRGAEQDPEVFARDITRLTPQRTIAEPDLSVLESRRALIGASSAARDAVAQLLATYPKPQPEPAAR